MGKPSEVKNKEVRLGVIGLGHWGGHYVRILSQSPGSRVTVCCDRDPDRINEIGRMFPFVDFTTEPAEVYGSPETDAVVVATPATTHYEIARECLRAGKDVLVEKPLALTAEEGMELVRDAEKAGLVLMVGHTFIYNAGIRKMKEMVEKGELGRVYYLLATRTHLGLIREDVNAIWDLAPHDISIASYVLGTLPLGVSAVGQAFLREGREDVAFATLHYPDDVIANIHVSWVDSNKERRVALVGSDRRVVFDDLNNLERVRIFEKGVSVEKPVTDFGEFQLLLRDGDIISPKVDPSEPLRNMCMHFLHCVKTRQKPDTNGRSGVEVIKVIKAIEKSLALKGGYVGIEW